MHTKICIKQKAVSSNYFSTYFIAIYVPSNQSNAYQSSRLLVTTLFRIFWVAVNLNETKYFNGM